MGRAQGHSHRAASAAAKRRRKAARGAGGGATVSTDVKQFINGTAESVSIRLDPTSVPKGPDFVLDRSGSGAHGHTGKAKHRADRKTSRSSLRSGNWRREY